MGRKAKPPGPGSAGFILVDSEWKLVYANPEAERILTHPQATRMSGSAWTALSKKLIPQLTAQNPSLLLASRAEFISGRRRYVCRALRLIGSYRRRPAGAALALVLERGGIPSRVIAEVCERFRLTRREREVVEFSIQGLTNKEIAARINISPNTVRSFVRMIMLKLGVSTRSGIVGVVFRTVYTAAS
jgi:DNA-binding CsgD family transcriptional regulator